MTLSPEASQALYADDSGLGLAEQLSAAYLRNVEGGLAPTTETAAHVAAAAIAQAALAPDRLSGQSVAIANLDRSAHGVLDEAQNRAQEVFTTFLGIRPPSLAELDRAGFDLVYYTEVLNKMEAEGQEPEILLVPRLSAEQWKDLYRALEIDDPSGHIKNGGLYINPNTEAAWENLTGPTPTGSPIYQSPADGISWHLSVVPGTEWPTQANVTHNDGAYEHKHPTVNDYLALQAGRLQRGEDPIDSASYTWLNGTTQSASRAPYGGWYSGDGRVSVNWSSVGDSVGYLGVRPTVW